MFGRTPILTSGRVAKALTLLFVASFFGGSTVFAAFFAQRASSVAYAWVDVANRPISRIADPSAPAAPRDTTPKWGGAERVNVLLLGLDCREEEGDGLCRNDTVMVATLHPASKTAGLLSFPRDVWIAIPLCKGYGFARDRINTVFVYAGVYRCEGGGLEMARQTVQYNLGVPIHYVAAVDFQGFVQAIDAIGGVTIDVQAPLKDNEYPTETYGIQRILFPPGITRMGGQEALQYARSRHQDSDIFRTQRQQQVLLGAREAALNLNLLPRVPRLVQEFRDLVRTDLSPAEIWALANIGKEVDLRGLSVRTVPSFSFTSSQGASLQELDSIGLRAITREMFSDKVRLDNGNLRVEVLNDSSTAGLASAIGSKLRDAGINVVNADSGTTSTLRETVIYAPAGTRKTADKIAAALGLPLSRVQLREPESDIGADIQVRLGNDLKLPESTQSR